jgi:opacity protein-like surface antigen
LNGSRLDLVSGGVRDQYSATVNAFYDLPLSGPMVPYIGGGAGVSHLNQALGVFSGPNVVRFTQLSSTSTDPAILGETGVAIAVNGNWSVVPAYRFEKVLTPSGAASSNINIFKIGFRYSPTTILADALPVRK